VVGLGVGGGVQADVGEAQGLDPAAVSAKGPAIGLAGEDDGKADGDRDDDGDAEDCSEQQDERPLEAAPGLLLFPEAIVFGLRHERLPKGVAKDRH